VRFRPGQAPLAVAALAAVAAALDAPPPLDAAVAQAALTLRERAIAGSRAVEWVRGLTDEAGPRLAGSPGDRAAVDWALATLRAQGFANVRAERVLVPVWRRGVETGEITAPWPHTLALTALGGSIPTPEGGLEAEIVELPSMDALEGNADRVKGKIVFFNVRMERAADMSGYARAVPVRSDGASRAGKLGAVGVLIRSIGTDHNPTPHTGGLRYADGAPKVPAAALAIPDAELLERLGRTGRPVRVRFSLGCRELPQAESANVIGEIKGGDKKDEIVLLGAHLDSWDLGTGAIDDGAGCGIVIEAARLIGQLPVKPRRTVRVVLFANEENGSAGGKAYALAHAAELPKHAAALEADSGTGAPSGLGWTAGPSAEALLKAIARILEPIGAGALKADGGGGADIGPLKDAGVPLFAAIQDTSRYFDFHHTANDTFDKIEPEALDRMVASVAVFAWVAAMAPEPFEKIPEEKRTEPRQRAP
jgi:carboxypeptidase Q